MGERAEEAKGRMKEAAGDVTGDEEMQREGKLDQASATAKGKVGKAKDKLSGLAGKVRGKKD